jgi:putative RecB family exonuclease
LRLSQEIDPFAPAFEYDPEKAFSGARFLENPVTPEQQVQVETELANQMMGSEPSDKPKDQASASEQSSPGRLEGLGSPDPFSPPKRLSVLQDEPLSVSRIRKASHCLHAFKLTYIDKVDKNSAIMTEFAEELQESSRWGVLVHGALERVYRHVLEEKIKGDVKDHVAVKAYRQAFIESQIRDEANYQRGLDIVRDYVGRTNFNYTDLIPESLGGGIERMFKLPAGEFWILGYIDLIEYHGEDVFEVVDFKTNKQMFTRQELDSDVQMSVYGWAIRELFQDVKEVRFRFEMLRHGVAQRAQRTPEQCIEGVRYLTDMARQLEVRKSFPPTLGMLCSWCNVNHHCKAYKEAQDPSNADTMVGMLANESLDIDDVCAAREKAYAAEKLLAKRRSNLDKIILSRLDRYEDGSHVSADNVRYMPIQRTEKHWTLKKIESAFKRIGIPAEQLDFEKFVKIQKGNLDEYVKTLNLDSSRRAMLTGLLDAVASVEKKQVYLYGRKIKR